MIFLFELFFFRVQDQEKIGMDIHQKNVRQQEQERQWKQLQAMRAREQQMQQMQTMPEKMHGNNTFLIFLKFFLH